MEISGRVHNGVVVFDGGPSLPEGAVVTIVCRQLADTQTNSPKRRIQLPLVHCERPGSVHLTGQLVAEILDAEDVAPRH